MVNFSGFNPSGFNKSNIISDVSRNFIGGIVYFFIDKRENALHKYISNLSKIKGKSITDKLLRDIFNDVDPIFIRDLILCQFFSILTFKNTDEEDKLYLLNATLQLGRKTRNNYLYTIISKSFKESNSVKPFKYFEGLSNWRKSKAENDYIYERLTDDAFVSKLGGMLIDILEYSDMFVKKLLVKSKLEKTLIRDVIEDE